MTAPWDPAAVVEVTPDGPALRVRVAGLGAAGDVVLRLVAVDLVSGDMAELGVRPRLWWVPG